MQIVAGLGVLSLMGTVSAVAAAVHEQHQGRASTSSHGSNSRLAT